MNANEKISRMLAMQLHNSCELTQAIESVGGDPTMVIDSDPKLSELLEIFARNHIRMFLDVQRPSE